MRRSNKHNLSDAEAEGIQQAINESKAGYTRSGDEVRQEARARFPNLDILVNMA